MPRHEDWCPYLYFMTEPSAVYAMIAQLPQEEG